MKKLLKLIKELHLIDGNLDNTIKRAYEAGKVDGVLQYLKAEIKKNEGKK